MSAAPESDVSEVERPSRFGQYRVVRMLAQGGMSQIFEGRHPQLGSRVALKVMQPALAAQPMAAQRFLREAKAASQIRHQNVVEVFDIGIESGVPFIVMEFLEGSDLAKLLAEKGAMPLAGIVDVFLPVISAVATAHQAGIIHRDLKPSNLMITHRAPRGAQPMVLDFGISKMIGEDLENTLTKSESLLGTVQYMAPELTKGAKFASAASDQYAIGVMLYECATGRRPFTGASHYDLMHAIVTAPVKAPSEVRDSLPREFDEVVLRAMSRDPSRRFASVQALGSALLSFGDKSAWALWEEDILRASENRREPWSTATDTLNDGAAPARAPRRGSGRSRAWQMRAALAVVTAYALVVTIFLARRRPPAPGVGEPRASDVELPVVVAPAATPIPEPASEKASAEPPKSIEPAASIATPSRVRKPATPKERSATPAAVAAPASSLTVAPRPISTVGTNGALIVE